MAAIDQVKAHFSAQSVRTIEVPEWGEDGKPLIIYARPMTLAEKQKLYTYAETAGQMECLAYTLILKAEDGQGNKLYTLEHKHALMHHADPDVVSRVVREITRVRTREDILKN